jgi:hypothetical protein
MSQGNILSLWEVFQLDGVPHHFSCHIFAFLDRKRGTYFLAPSFSRFDFLGFFLLGAL